MIMGEIVVSCTGLATDDERSIIPSIIETAIIIDRRFEHSRSRGG
jgi:hypothetical protein